MSTTTKLKICGITTLEDARFAAGAMADYIGFVFHDKSPRSITPREAAEIGAWISGPQFVGVFVNEQPEHINRIAERAALDLVQLHGQETPADALMLNRPVIKALRIEPQTTTHELAREMDRWKDVARYLLLDTWSARAWGGTGEAWDWSVAESLARDIPFFLAGGISADNVALAVRQAKPYGIDVSSSLESEPGRKDFDKMERFFDQWNELNEGA